MMTLEGRPTRWLGPVEQSEVVNAEEKLGVPIPQSYRDFLLRYGSGLVGQYEIYGLGGPSTGVPNVLWLIEDLEKS